MCIFRAFTAEQPPSEAETGLCGTHSLSPDLSPPAACTISWLQRAWSSAKLPIGQSACPNRCQRQAKLSAVAAPQPLEAAPGGLQGVLKDSMQPQHTVVLYRRLLYPKALAPACTGPGIPIPKHWEQQMKTAPLGKQRVLKM